VVDHLPARIVHPTSKLRARKPFPKHELWTLREVAPLIRAERSDSLDVTEKLAHTDNQMVSPVHLREPQCAVWPSHIRFYDGLWRIGG